MNNYQKKDHSARIAVFIVFVCLTGAICLLSHMDDDSSSSEDHSPLITDSSRTIPNTNISVYFETKYPFHEDEYTNFIDQPQVLLDYAGSIYVCDGTGDNDCTEEFGEDESKTFNDIGGFAAWDGSGDVYIHKFNDEDPDWYHDSLTHELGHQFDYANGISSSLLWEQLYQQDPKAISEYGGTDEVEFFAEACDMYFNDPDQMQSQTRLPVYNAMQEIFHNY